jgi:hypothetical protein
MFIGQYVRHWLCAGAGKSWKWHEGTVRSIIKGKKSRKGKVELQFREFRRIISVSTFKEAVRIDELNKALMPRGKVCNVKVCNTRTSCRYTLIGPNRKAGSEHWDSLRDAYICNTCLKRFLRTGSVEAPY